MVPPDECTRMGTIQLNLSEVTFSVRYRPVYRHDAAKPSHRNPPQKMLREGQFLTADHRPAAPDLGRRDDFSRPRGRKSMGQSFRTEFAADPARGRVEFDATGKPVLMRGASLDNTARKLAEQAAHYLSGRLIHAQEQEQMRLARVAGGIQRLQADQQGASSSDGQGPRVAGSSRDL
jgi:hypothetical protein